MQKNTRRGGGVPLSVSQNFLTSAGTIRRLLAYTGIGAGDLVYEIGPGKGHITRELLRKGAQVRAVELDPRLFRQLAGRFAGEPRLSLRQGDFLTVPLPETGSYKVFSNIPFSRTTAILRKLTEAPNPPRAAWLIVEEGAAKRFCSAFGAAPGSSLLSLSLRPFFELRTVCRLNREQFHPAPSVDCALLCIRRKGQPDLPPAQRAAYRRFLERARKQGLRAMLTKKQISNALRLAGLPQPSADKNLLYVQWLCLFRYYLSIRKTERPLPGTASRRP